MRRRIYALHFSRAAPSADKARFGGFCFVDERYCLIDHCDRNDRFWPLVIGRFRPRLCENPQSKCSGGSRRRSSPHQESSSGIRMPSNAIRRWHSGRNHLLFLEILSFHTASTRCSLSCFRKADGRGPRRVNQSSRSLRTLNLH